MNTVLKIRYMQSGTQYNINFTEDEVATLTVHTLRRLDLQRLQNRKPIITFLGDRWRKVTVDFFPANPGVQDDVETIRDLTDDLTLIAYYSDGSTIAEKIAVKVDPNVPTYFIGGEKDAQRMLQLVFYEVTHPVGVFIPELDLVAGA